VVLEIEPSRETQYKYRFWGKNTSLGNEKLNEPNEKIQWKVPTD
jgi:hypothetical protein